MTKSKIKSILLFCLISFFLNCRNENNDYVPNIVYVVDINETYRLDYYKNKNGTLIIYLTDDYADKNLLISKLSLGLNKAKEIWCFKVLNFNITSSNYFNMEFRKEMTELLEELFLSEIKYKGKHADGFVLEVKNDVGKCD